MKVYFCTRFTGHYPTGTAAIIVAKSVEDAVTLINSELEAIGLKQEVTSADLVVVNTRKQSINILCDGDY